MARFFTSTYPFINIHKKASDKSEIVTQMIYGDSFSIIITPLFGILCLLAYVQIRRRKKITLRRWAKEENYYESKEDRWRRLNEEHVMLKEREE